MRAVALGLALIGGLTMAIALPKVASAQYFTGVDGHRYYSESTSKRPRHGYSGFAFSGNPLNPAYCSYQRIPNRACRTTRSGKRRCRVVSWTLKQYCY